jgi:hypothetical protein
LLSRLIAISTPFLSTAKQEHRTLTTNFALISFRFRVSLSCSAIAFRRVRINIRHNSTLFGAKFHLFSRQKNRKMATKIWLLHILFLLSFFIVRLYPLPLLLRRFSLPCPDAPATVHTILIGLRLSIDFLASNSPHFLSLSLSLLANTCTTSPSSSSSQVQMQNESA